MQCSYIINHEQKKTALLSTSNPQSVFVETFLQNYEHHDSTHTVTESKCKIGDDIKPFIEKGTISMFNIFDFHLLQLLVC